MPACMMHAPSPARGRPSLELVPRSRAHIRSLTPPIHRTCAKGIEVWTEDGARTLDDQSVLQLRLTRTDDGSPDTPTEDSVDGLLQQLAGSLPLKALRSASDIPS